MTPRLPGRGGDPRAALLDGCPEALSDQSLLSIVLGEPGGAAALLDTCAGPGALWRVTAEELVALPGVGPAGAARLLACLEVSRRAACWTTGTAPSVTTPEDVVSVCGPQLRGLDREHFWALALNTKNRLLRIFEVSVGSLNASIVHPRELFKDAVRISAASLVVVHNHPSGDSTPSGADIQLTRRLVKAGDVLGIDILDHVVLGDGGAFSSMRELGLM